MRVKYNLKRLQDVARAVFIQKNLYKHEQWNRQELERFQNQQLSSLVTHAVHHSPFYKEFYKHLRIDQGVVLHELPIIDKATMMENFDKFVTDPRLKLTELQAHIRQLARDEYYLGEYRVFSTSGSSGLKGVFVFNRKEWSTVIAGGIRCASLSGVSPRLPKRWKSALIVASSPMHVTYRFYVSADVGLHKFLRLEATSSIEDLVASLNDFQPEWLTAYSSIASLLAIEQLEGRLNIHPKVVSTNSGVRTKDMEDKIREAWGVQPFNTYGMTEAGLVLGSDCSFHRGIHAYEDLFTVEVLDEQNRAVPDGSPGYKLLITNLFNFTQPLIRYEISDMITMAAEPCPCGRPFRLIDRIEGRGEDIIYLKSPQGRAVPVHPNHFHNPIEALHEIKQYQVVHEEDGIHISLILREGASEEKVAGKLRENLRGDLESLGAKCPDIHIHFVERIERDPQKMGKLKLIKSNI
jgi:phenylacetate-CoA ligase